MQFTELCEFFENVQNTKKLNDKRDIVKKFFKNLRENHSNIIFSIIRLILPGLDKYRSAYRIKAYWISKIIIRILVLPPGNDQNTLYSAASSKCDFGNVVYTILRKYISNFKSELTINELNDYLDQIANRENDNNLDDLMEIIFQKCSPTNTKWIVQIILKDLKLGIDNNSILNCYHMDGSNLYLSNNNLKKVCDLLKDIQVKLHELELNLFEPFRPMLSKRIDKMNFCKYFTDEKSYFIENKFDGERFQLHKDCDRFHYYSRNGFNFTEYYGSTYDKGILTPKLINVFNENVQKIILDGEMMLWNNYTKKFGSKGMKYDVKKLKDNSRYQPCFCVFDILLLNNNKLTNIPLKRRLELLRKIIKTEIEGTIIISKYKLADNKQIIIDELNKSVDNEEEGIIVKDSQSIYKFGERNCGWFKLKMDFFDDVVHDLDVLLMAGCFNYNRKIINSFFVGIISDKQYLFFGRISSGLNDEQLDFLTNLLKTKGIDFNLFSTRNEGYLQFGRDTPDIYIEPINSCLLKIRASELIRTTNDHVKTPYTLRFPRVLEIRTDKPINECLSMNDLLELTRQNKSVIKLNKRHIELNELITKTKSFKRKKIEILLKDDKKIGNFLEGYKFFVANGTDNWRKDDIYNSIKQFSGDITYVDDNTIDVYLVGNFNEKIKKRMTEPHEFDIISVNWLQRLLNEKTLLTYKHEEIYSIGGNYRSRLSSNFDCFGDSFTQEATIESLKHIIEMMKIKEQFININGTVKIETKTFENILAYFDNYEIINDPNSSIIYSSFLDQIDFRFHKGVISDKLTPDCDIIICDNMENRIDILKKFLSDHDLENKINIVPKEYLYDYTD